MNSFPLDMDEKLNLAHRQDPIPRPTSTSTVYDSDFESHDDASTLYTPRSSLIRNSHPDLPPTYDESQAAVLDSAGVRQPPPPAFPYPPGVENHSDITVYRTEIPPDPVVPIRGQGEDSQQPEYPPEKQRPISPIGPRASGLLSEALRFTEAPPLATETHPRLRVPVAVPTLARSAGVVKFARFFAAVLESHSITASQFLDFIDGLNALATASSFTTSTFHTRNALSSFEVPRDDSDIPREDLISAYIALSNTHFFNPRGLQVQISDLSQLADLVNMSNTVIRKAVLEEVLRNAKAGIDVPAAANGAAHAAAQALVPYIDPLTTAVPEPKKNNESMESVAFRLAALDVNKEEITPADSTQGATRGGFSRSQSSPSQLPQPQPQSPMEGPSRSPSWAEWGDSLGRKWGRWGENQGKRWGDWGGKQGEFWEKWGQEKARKFSEVGDTIGKKAEVLTSPPWARRGGGRHGRFPLGGGPFGNYGGPFVGARVGPFGGRGGPGGPGTPFGGGPHALFGGVPGVPFGPFGGRRSMTDMYPPGPGYAEVPVTPMAGQSVGHIPAVPAMPSIPGAYPQTSQTSLHNIHQPPPIPGVPYHQLPTLAGPYQQTAPPGGPFGIRGDMPSTKHEEEDDDDAASISSSSSSDSTDTDRTYTDPERVFSEKVAAIEKMAETARATSRKPAKDIEKERTKALYAAEKERTKLEWAVEKQARKKELKADKKGWKAGKKGEYRAWKREMKNSKREWKRGVKAEMRQLKEEIRRVKREGKRRDCDGGWHGRHDHGHGWGGRPGRDGTGGRGGRYRYAGGEGEERGVVGGPSMESLARSGTGASVDENSEVEVRAREMLWVVVTNYD